MLMNKKGFTVIELTIVLSIIGIISIIAIPSYLAWLPRHELKTSVRHIYDDMNRAKFKAIKSNTVAVIIFSIPNDTYTVFLDSSGNWALDAFETTISTGTLENGVDITGSTLPSHTYGFNNRGMSASNPGQVQLTNGSGLLMGVRVNVAGSLSIISSTDGGTTWS
jgi:prepilin-type N-terminal cleavage/methylation domain-containing protein